MHHKGTTRRVVVPPTARGTPPRGERWWRCAWSPNLRKCSARRIVPGIRAERRPEDTVAVEEQQQEEQQGETQQREAKEGEIRWSRTEQVLKESGLTQERAKLVLKAWKEAGADDPKSLKKLVKRRGAQQSVNEALQLLVDGSSAVVSWYCGLQIAETGSLGPLSLAGEFLLYTLAMYQTINATLDVFQLIAIGTATRRYSENSAAFLAAVQTVAGPETGLELVDKARQAVATVQVLQALDDMFQQLSKGVEGGRDVGDFLRDLGAYLVIVKAESKGYDVEKEDRLTKNEVMEVAAEFALADGNDDGAIDVFEFRELGRKTGTSLSVEEAEAAVGMLDSNNDRVVDFPEFLAWFIEKKKENPS